MKLVKTLWAIWWARNRRDDKVISPLVAVELSSKVVSQWQAAQKGTEGDVSRSTRTGDKGPVKWQPPVMGWHKVNIEAAVHVGAPDFRVGMILRNDKGEFVEGMLRSFKEEASVLEAEARGLHEALLWLRKLGVRQVIVECDSLSVVNAVLKNIMYMSEVGTIFEECRSILRQRSDVKVQHVC